MLHRAGKPGNVVRGDPVTLVDFAFAPTTPLHPYVRDVSAGVRYVSPKQAGLLHRDVDEPPDLYSAGALLFECLAGGRPSAVTLVRPELPASEQQLPAA